MQLPLEIKPDPLVTTSVELRFNINKDPLQLPGLILPLFSSDLPNVTTNTIPRDLRLRDENLFFQPDYIMRNDKFSFSFGPNSILLETLGIYPLWPAYFSFIKSTIEKFFSLKIVTDVFRIGLRYANVFDHRHDLKAAIKYFPSLNIPGYDETVTLYRADLRKEQIQIILQIASNARVKRPEKEVSGILVDIDCYSSTSRQADQNILDVINLLHTEEKIMFYDILTTEFIKTLNPRYD